MRVRNFDAGKVGFSHSRFAASAHSTWLSIFEYYFSLHVSPIHLWHGVKKAVALLMGLYKREKFHMYSPALYRLKSRQPGAFLHPRMPTEAHQPCKTHWWRENIGGGRRYIHQFHKPFSQYFRTAFSRWKLIQMWERKGKLFLNFPT